MSGFANSRLAFDSRSSGGSRTNAGLQMWIESALLAERYAEVVVEAAVLKLAAELHRLTCERSRHVSDCRKSRNDILHDAPAQSEKACKP